MRYIKLSNNIVQDIIPDINPELPGFTIQERYSAEYIKDLLAIDNDELLIEVGMTYDKLNHTFFKNENVAKKPTQLMLIAQ